MAFPVIASVGTQNNESLATDGTLVFTMPSGIAAGNLLVALAAINGNPGITPPGDWTQLFFQANGSTMRFWAGYKFAAGSDTLTLTGTVGNFGCCLWCGRVTSAHASTPPESAVNSLTLGNAADPPSLNPAAWDVEDTLWIAAAGENDGRTVTGYPTNYNLNQVSLTHPTANTMALGVCARQLAAASEDPGAFTATDVPANIGVTIGIRPVAGFIPKAVIV